MLGLENFYIKEFVFTKTVCERCGRSPDENILGIDCSPNRQRSRGDA